jgi:hypothetical protein
MGCGHKTARSDQLVVGRNYYSRLSAEACEEKDEERELIVEDTVQLKQLAVDFLHPES